MSQQKESAVSFLKMVVADKVQEAYDRFTGEDFIHHNQYFKGDRQSLLEAMKEANLKAPNKKLEVKFVYEDGDRVITHSHVKMKPDEPGITVFHVFRFKSGKVVELWDVGQVLEKNSPNENGPF